MHAVAAHEAAQRVFPVYLPGMPCRLWTPQVSRRPILASRAGVAYT